MPGRRRLTTLLYAFQRSERRSFPLSPVLPSFFPLSSLGPPRWPSLARHNFLRSSMTSERRTELGKKRVGTGPARPSRLSLFLAWPRVVVVRRARDEQPADPSSSASSSPPLSSPLSSILLCSALLYSTLLYSTVLYSTLLSSPLPLLLRSASFFAATA